MKVNFLVEKSGRLKYLGCATAAEYLRKGLADFGIKVSVNSEKKDFDIAHAHTFGPFVLTHRNTGKIKIISAHSTPSLNIGNVLGPLWLWNFIYRTIYNMFDYVITVSETSAKEMKKIGVKSELKVIPNGIDNRKFVFSREKRKKFRKMHGFCKHDIVVLNVAQKTPRKGVLDFIDTAKKLPGMKFVWIGGMPYSYMTSGYGKVKKAIENAPRNLIFPGFVKDITEAYSGADIFFAPTKAESFGLTLVEAGACRLPVVARPLPVFRELFGNSIMYAKGRDGFEKALLGMSGKKKRKTFSKRACEMSKKYTRKMVAQETAAFYRKVIGEK